MTIRRRIYTYLLGGSGIVAVWMTLKTFVPTIGEIGELIFGGTLSDGISFAFNVIVPITLFVLFLPHSLYGYCQK